MSTNVSTGPTTKGQQKKTATCKTNSRGSAWYATTGDGRHRLGPMSKTKLDALVMQQEVTADWLLLCEGWTQWRHASALDRERGVPLGGVALAMVGLGLIARVTFAVSAPPGDSVEIVASASTVLISLVTAAFVLVGAGGILGILSIVRRRNGLNLDRTSQQLGVLAVFLAAVLTLADVFLI